MGKETRYAQGQLLIQLVTANGELIRFPGGGNPPKEHTLEADLIAILAAEIHHDLDAEASAFARDVAGATIARGVGVLKTETHVAGDVIASVTETFDRRIRHFDIADAVRRAIQKFKNRSVER